MNHLLTDEQIHQSIVNGFISVKTNLLDSIRKIIFKKSITPTDHPLMRYAR